MGNLTVRRRDDRVIERFKAQAKANQHSVEGGIHYVLTRQVDRGGCIAGLRERTRRLLSPTADTSQTDNADLLRDDRKRCRDPSILAGG